MRVDAQRRMYQLDPAGFQEMDEWLTRVRRFWRGKLDALERVLKDDDRNVGRKKS